MVQNYAARPRDAYVTLTVEGRIEPVASRRVLAPPGDKRPVVLTFEPRAEDHGKGLVVAALAGRRARRSTTSRTAASRPARRCPSSSPRDAPYSWTTRALDADPDVDLQRLTLEQLAHGERRSGRARHRRGRLPGDAARARRARPRAARRHVPRRRRRRAGRQAADHLVGDRRPAPALPHARRRPRREGRRALEAARRRRGASCARRHHARRRRVDPRAHGDHRRLRRRRQRLAAQGVVRPLRAQRRRARAPPSRPGGGGPGAHGRSARASPSRRAPRRCTSKGPACPSATLAAQAAASPSCLRSIAPASTTCAGTTPHVGEALVAANLTSDARERRPTAHGDRRRAARRPHGAATVRGARTRTTSGAPGSRLLAALALAFDVYWRHARQPRSPTSRTGAVIPTLARLWMLVLGVAFVVVAAVIARDRGAGASVLRPRRLAIALAGAAPLVYEGLVHARPRPRDVRALRPPARARAASRRSRSSLACAALATPAAHERAGAARSSSLLSSLAALAAALAVAEPELGRPLDRLTVVVARRSIALDRSGARRGRPRRAPSCASPRRRCTTTIASGTVVFGAEAATEDPPRPRSESAAAAAVEVGRDAHEPRGRDPPRARRAPGRHRRRASCWSPTACRRAATRSPRRRPPSPPTCPIDVVVARSEAGRPTCASSSVRAPTRADEGEPFDLRVVTSSAIATDVEVRVEARRRAFAPVRAHVEAGEDVLRLREIAADPGLHRYDVEVTALDPTADGVARGQRGERLRARPRRRRSRSSSRATPGKARRSPARSRRAASTRSSAARPASRPTSAASRALRSRRPRATCARAISRRRRSTRSPATRATSAADSSSWAAIRSMGPGGYARTPIEEVSPVAFDLKQEKRRASLAEVIAIDYSRLDGRHGQRAHEARARQRGRRALARRSSARAIGSASSTSTRSSAGPSRWRR